MRLIIASKADPVSMRVAEFLIESYGFQESGQNLFRKGDTWLRFIQERHIFANGLGEEYGPELVIVASSHKSVAGVKALLTHPVGNWGSEASMGGLPETLSPTSAAALYTALHALSKQLEALNLSDWKVGLEVTHHGPATRAPTIFIEAGGPPDKLPEQKAVEAVASACIEVAEASFTAPKPAVGFGGGHYAPCFTRLALNNEYSFGHMCPKYAMPINRSMIIEAIEKTVEKPRLAVVDWKGLKGRDREFVVKVLKDLGVEWIKA